MQIKTADFIKLAFSAYMYETWLSIIPGQCFYNLEIHKTNSKKDMVPWRLTV